MGNLLDSISTKTACELEKEKCVTCDSDFNCRNDGSFAPTQCNLTKGVCWCVDSRGKKIPHTTAVIGEEIECDDRHFVESEASCNSLVLHTIPGNLMLPRICLLKKYSRNVKAVSMGSNIDFSPLNNGTFGFTVTLTQGSSCETYPEKKYSTVIEWKCPDFIHHFPEIRFVRFEGCTLYLEWYSIEICPMCKREDYHLLKSGCMWTMAGARIITYANWNQPKICKNGVSLPPGKGEFCSIPIPVGPDEKIVSRKSLVLSPGAIGGIVAGGLLFLFISVLIIYYIKRQINDIRNKYTVLKDEKQSGTASQSA